jgi:chromate reductase, NAD(P)H dehydrogenase (quinone)
MRVLGLSGSLRRESHNRALLRAAAALMPPGAELVEWDRIAELPAYDEDLDGAPGPAPEPVRALREAIADADALLIATPEYNASLPGALKNALDWASRPHATNPLRGKPAAVIGASTGLFGAVWAQAEARKVLATIGASVLERELPVGQAHDAWGPDGTLQDPDLRAALADVVAELVDGESEFRAAVAASGDVRATSPRAEAA